MKIQIDNRITNMVFIDPSIHQSNAIIYHEQDEGGLHVREHSFPSNFPHNFNDDRGFWINGHHYRTGKMVGMPCDLPLCKICPKDIKVVK